jgi:uncharacterized protein (DUF2062 family)/SAM-dependent methyltransferase
VIALRTESGSPARDSAAIATGVFIGCLPFYGFHLLICGAAGTVLRLNRLKMYLAANISNPFVAPWLAFFEIQTGGWVRRGAFHPLTVDTVMTTNLATFGADLLVGSVVIGLTLGGLAGWTTYLLVRGTGDRDAFTELCRLASDRYIDGGVIAWEFVRGKLRGDPIYRASVCGGLLTRSSNEPALAASLPAEAAPGRTLVDVGCGLGMTLALLAEARRAQATGTWPADWPPPPCFERMVGVEKRARVAMLAAAALANDAEVITADARTAPSLRAHTFLLFDVLHMMRRDEQEALLASMASALDPGGLMLIREADAAAGWRFTAVRWGNRLKALAFGSWRQQFHFRTAVEWQECLTRHGLQADVREMSAGTPFANVLLRVTPRQP